MEKSPSTPTTSSTTPSTATPAPTQAATPTATTAPATTPNSKTQNSAEEVCGSVNILDTTHLKNLVDDLSKLYSTSVCTKVAKDTKIAAEKRLIEAIRANLDRYEG